MSQKNGMTTCKVCGAEIAKSAKICPKCGAKNKKPVYKRVWFWILIVIVIMIIAAAAGSGDSDSDSSSSGGKQTETKQSAKRNYKAVTASALQKALEDNAASAADQYKGKYLAVTGPFSVIDSDGEYMTISTGEYEIIDIHCNFKTDAQRKKAKSLHKGQTIPVKGKITDVGEVRGYSMDIDSFRVTE